MKILRLTFQQPGSDGRKQMVLALDMEEHASLSTKSIAGLADRMETALPGIFPHPSSPLVHNCGGEKTGVPEHSFREEVERGTDVAHLLEHVLLHLLSRRTCCCSGFCGQRSTDLEKGISTHHYIVLDYPSEIEAVVAVGIGFDLVTAWIDGRTVRVDPGMVYENISRMIAPMVEHGETQCGMLRQT